jgi:ppGpp synthetase/RelA/SpoT-type nucleotidyltranferase
MAKLSKTQIDRLGDRLREGSPSENDLRVLDEYRLSFGEAYDTVVRTIREQLQLEPTGRPAKSTSSLIEKLLRESIRLSQVQDIAGCRVVVADVAEQEQVVVSLCSVFPGGSVVDRRANPSYGYRAVHVIAQLSGKLIEIQVRSSLQHLWAELSEKWSDVVDSTIKYGGGKEEIRHALTGVSETLADFEVLENKVVRQQQKLGHLQHGEQIQKLKQEMAGSKEKMLQRLREGISLLQKQEVQKQ